MSCCETKRFFGPLTAEYTAKQIIRSTLEAGQRDASVATILACTNELAALKTVGSAPQRRRLRRALNAALMLRLVKHVETEAALGHDVLQSARLALRNPREALARTWTGMENNGHAVFAGLAREAALTANLDDAFASRLAAAAKHAQDVDYTGTHNKLGQSGGGSNGEVSGPQAPQDPSGYQPLPPIQDPLGISSSAPNSTYPATGSGTSTTSGSSSSSGSNQGNPGSGSGSGDGDDDGDDDTDTDDGDDSDDDGDGDGDGDATDGAGGAVGAVLIILCVIFCGF